MQGLHGDISSSTTTDTLLLEIAQLLEERHVVPDVGIRGADMLRTAVAKQHYRDAYDTPDQFAALVTADLRRATGDGHLYLEYLSDATTPDVDWIAEWRAAGPTQNWGVKEIRILPDNIGYLKLTSFYTYALALPALCAAMELIRHTAGLVFDLTDNGGGDDTTAHAVMWTFLDPHTPSPLVIETRAEQEPPMPVPELAWLHYGADRPLVILINQRTFSAPEAVAYALQQEQRAVIVGGRSGGGANITDAAIQVAPHFNVGIPNRRPISRITNTNWEGVGVLPDIETSDADSLREGCEIVRRKLLDARG
jgi:hypothetical protein